MTASPGDEPIENQPRRQGEQDSDATQGSININLELEKFLIWRNFINTAIMKAQVLNATGLSAEESRKLKPREERPDEKTIIRCLKELYTCKPSENSYEMYSEDATFHDPIAIATPLPQIKSQFNGMPKIFSSSTIDKFEILESPATLPTPPGPDQFTIINQDVTYYRGESKLITLNSLLTLQRDQNGKVVRHTEEWSHNKVTDKSDGFLGQLNEWRKKLTAGVIGKIVSDEPPKLSQKQND
ncbi:hypothetical protein O181_093110 [Austropuccinia psidii MF-1]|uniref:Uncharacterized protein n=1 Tax=Austropuccinia psidii MF-1 TaxID=1389203 RepID=A0A9Q3IZR9_9BASI|nr:hypothetical protein [Austropuccinia psidii MF-1]